jgi:hypothetical protein
MTKLKRMKNPKSRHHERSGAESKDPAALAIGIATGLKVWPRAPRWLRCSLDFARNDGPVFLSFLLGAFFVIRHSNFVLRSS